MAISYHYENIKKLPIKQKEISLWIKEVAVTYSKRVGDISYLFCSDEKILEINNQYLQHDYYTDIITFDYSEKNTISGDIFISVDTVKSNAVEFGESFEKELYRVIIHGVLHLCGQNDIAPEEQEEMTKKENLAIEQILFSNFTNL